MICTKKRTNKGSAMEAVAYSTFRQNLRTYLDKTRDDAIPVLITSLNPESNAVLVNQRDWDSLQETLYILSDEKLMQKIRRGDEEFASGKALERELIDD